MKLHTTISLVVFIMSAYLLQAQSWKFESQVSPSGFFLLSGTIDGDKHIHMRLEHDDQKCGIKRSSRNTRTLKGSYYYSDKANLFLPLTGSYNSADKNKFVRLYVPADPTAKLDKRNCEPGQWYEVFENNEEFDLTSMRWKSVNMSETIPVELRLDHDPGNETRAEVIFAAKDRKPLIINISQKAQARHISAIEDIDSKLVEGNYYATFSFYERSRQDGISEARCGNGIEKYLGFIRINDRYELEEIAVKKVESCWQPERVEKVKAVKGKPELGLQDY